MSSHYQFVAIVVSSYLGIYVSHQDDYVLFCLGLEYMVYSVVKVILGFIGCVVGSIVLPGGLFSCV